mmetsp:Transcript_4464/g.8166  ORF Transcript_4464/g.8166 Transcript_4464/m.8166 type:complete len:97 (+) Transcript_4464:2855-3145(+)
MCYKPLARTGGSRAGRISQQSVLEAYMMSSTYARAWLTWKHVALASTLAQNNSRLGTLPIVPWSLPKSSGDQYYVPVEDLSEFGMINAGISIEYAA